MKKILFALCVFLGTVSVSKAQVFVKTDHVLSVGLGVGGTNLYSGSNYSMRIPPLNASYEVALTNQWSLGATLGIAGSRYQYFSNNNGIHYDYDYNYTYILVGARGAYHFYTDYTWDVYAGASLGLNIVSGNWNSTVPGYVNYSTDQTGVYFGLFAGARYFFSRNVAAFAELGYNIGTLNLGVSFRL
ncbi:MAG: hypothetical protein ACEPOV_13690 [Hyphomicrobiales bacterium]